MIRAHNRAWTRRIAFTAGLALAVAAVLSLQVTSGAEPLGANVTVSAVGNGEVHIAQSDAFLRSRQLPPGAAADGALRVTNQTGERLAVRVRADGSSSDLDALLDVSLAAEGRELFRGRLGELRSWTRRPFFIRAGQTDTLRMKASLPRGSNGHEGRAADVKLEFRSRPLGGSR